MYVKKSAKSPIMTAVVFGILIACAFLLITAYLKNEIELYESSKRSSITAFDTYTPQPFINSAAHAEPFIQTLDRGDALYYFDAPEGFTVISYSEPWDEEMLKLLYEELKLNTHGSEIEQLYKISIYPHEDDEGLAQATYTPGLTTVSLYLRYPSFPDDFTVDFPIYTGQINIYGGDTRTTIESIAGSLSHEYGHHYTFYYMFDSAMRRDNLLIDSEYARLREARINNLIADIDIGPDYMANRHRYIIEVAAEDYVTLMGSITTRQVADYYDVKDLVENEALSGDRRVERNAFPQENMMLPPASDVPGLSEYFYSFIDAEPPIPEQEKQEIIIDISRQSSQHNLTDGPRTFIYYNIKWNTPYTDAIYTIACYDPLEYAGWGYPIRTVRPTARASSSATAVVGNYAQRRGNSLVFIDDSLGQGIKVFYVVAQLPDGTYYTSVPLEFNFG